MSDKPAKKKPRGKPFPKGVSGNPGGKPSRLTKVGATLMTELFKPVEATINGKPVKTTQYKLFVQQLIKSAITGSNPSRKLLLEFMRDHEVREKLFADEVADQKAGGLLQLDWAAEEQSVMEAAIAKLNAVRK